jgi:hypothetical protein
MRALCWCFSEPHEWMFPKLSPSERIAGGCCHVAGERKECYAITENASRF